MELLLGLLRGLIGAALFLGVPCIYQAWKERPPIDRYGIGALAFAGFQAGIIYSYIINHPSDL